MASDLVWDSMSPTDPPLPDVEIEERIAHLTRMVEDLSDVLRLQGDQIDRLTRQVQRLSLREAEREIETGAQIPLADQRPPHW
jgi:SlyX protein